MWTQMGEGQMMMRSFVVVIMAGFHHQRGWLGLRKRVLIVDRSQVVSIVLVLVLVLKNSNAPKCRSCLCTLYRH